MLNRPPRVSAAVKGLSAAAFYGIVSISITFFNKAVLSSYAFRYPNLMTLFQMAFSLLLLVVAKSANMITYPDFSVPTAKRVSPLAISFIGMVLTGLGALNHLNIPMFNALRQVTTLITMSSEFYLLGVRASMRVRLSVYIMVGGAIIAGVTDPTYSSTGYFLVALNCLFTAMYLLCIAKFSKESQSLGTFGLMFYNNLLSLPFVILICLFTGDFAAFSKYPYIKDAGFIFCFTLQSGLAFILNYSIFLCTNINSALTTSVTGQVKNIMTTALGFFMFGDVKYNTLNVMGLLVSLVASCVYSYLKYLESEEKKAKKRNDELLSTPSQPIHVHSQDKMNTGNKDGHLHTHTHQQDPTQSPDPYHSHSSHSHSHPHAVHVNVHPQANLHSREHALSNASAEAAAQQQSSTHSYSSHGHSHGGHSHSISHGHSHGPITGSSQPVFSINSAASSGSILNLPTPMRTTTSR